MWISIFRKQLGWKYYCLLADYPACFSSKIQGNNSRCEDFLQTMEDPGFAVLSCCSCPLCWRRWSWFSWSFFRYWWNLVWSDVCNCSQIAIIITLTMFSQGFLVSSSLIVSIKIVATGQWLARCSEGHCFSVCCYSLDVACYLLSCHLLVFSIWHSLFYLAGGLLWGLKWSSDLTVSYNRTLP